MIDIPTTKAKSTEMVLARIIPQEYTKLFGLGDWSRSNLCRRRELPELPTKPLCRVRLDR